jgi:hypothetical protein
LDRVGTRRIHTTPYPTSDQSRRPSALLRRRLQRRGLARLGGINTPRMLESLLRGALWRHPPGIAPGE